jgi:hypothetical protein
MPYTNASFAMRFSFPATLSAAAYLVNFALDRLPRRQMVVSLFEQLNFSTV